MLDLVYRDQRPALTPAQKEALKARFGELVYESFLSKVYKNGNGGAPLKQIITSLEQIEYWFQYVFPVPGDIESEKNNIFKNNDHYKEEGIVPEDYIIFAEDPGANLFSVNKETGGVYYHATDMWDEDASLSENHDESISLVSADIDVFLHSLRIKED